MQISFEQCAAKSQIVASPGHRKPLSGEHHMEVGMQGVTLYTTAHFRKEECAR